MTGERVKTITKNNFFLLFFNYPPFLKKINFGLRCVLFHVYIFIFVWGVIVITLSCLKRRGTRGGGRDNWETFVYFQNSPIFLQGSYVDGEHTCFES